MLEHQRLDWLRTQVKLLSQVRSKIASGVYTLTKWRLGMRGADRRSITEHFQGDKKKSSNKSSKDRKDRENKQKFTNIVNKILASKTGEDCQVDSDNRSDSGNADNNENYNIYD